MSRQSLNGRRRHVIIPEPQDDKLTKLAKSTGLTPSEHIRRAIDSYFRLLEAAEKRATK
jgi:hypothetical protein